MRWVLAISPLLLARGQQGPQGGPEQLHLALTDSPEQVVVSFATSKGYKDKPACRVGGSEFSGRTTTYTEGGWEGLLHTVVLSGLKAATRYQYCCGSKCSAFETAPPVGHLPIAVAAVGDLGANCDRDGCGNATIASLAKGAASGAYSMLLHAGDLAYSHGHTVVWDDFLRDMEPVAGRVPYMVAVGNQEHWFNFTAYRRRFAMPGLAASNENLWYSFDHGGVHVAAFSTEHHLELQTDWLRADLQRAAANRAQVPWIVVMAHKPLYCSTNDYYDCRIGCKKISGHVESILKDAGVDLFLAGHLHNYERTWPVFNGEVTAQSYTDPKAPVHLVIGMAGDNEGLTDSWMKETPDWRATKAAKLGYTMLYFDSAASMRFEYILSDSGEVEDSFTISKGGGETETIVV